MEARQSFGCLSCYKIPGNDPRRRIRTGSPQAADELAAYGDDDVAADTNRSHHSERSRPAEQNGERHVFDDERSHTSSHSQQRQVKIRPLDHTLQQDADRLKSYVVSGHSKEPAVHTASSSVTQQEELRPSAAEVRSKERTTYCPASNVSSPDDSAAQANCPSACSKEHNSHCPEAQAKCLLGGAKERLAVHENEDAPQENPPLSPSQVSTRSERRREKRVE